MPCYIIYSSFDELDMFRLSHNLVVSFSRNKQGGKICHQTSSYFTHLKGIYTIVKFHFIENFVGCVELKYVHFLLGS